MAGALTASVCHEWLADSRCRNESRFPTACTSSPSRPAPEAGSSGSSSAADAARRVLEYFDAAVAVAYGWPVDINAADALSELRALNGGR